MPRHKQACPRCKAGLLPKNDVLTCPLCGWPGRDTRWRDPVDEGPPRPDELWAQADAEHPGDAEGRHARYVELMVEHGHLILDSD